MPLFTAVLSVEECSGVCCIEPAVDRSWGLRCKCITCSEESPTFVYVVVGELHAGKGGGFHQMMYKCSACKSLISADTVPKSFGKFCEDSVGVTGNGAVVTFDIRGGEPIELEMDDQWIVTSEGGKQFTETDLSEDWVDYDEDNVDTVAHTSGLSWDDSSSSTDTDGVKSDSSASRPDSPCASSESCSFSSHASDATMEYKGVVRHGDDVAAGSSLGVTSSAPPLPGHGGIGEDRSHSVVSLSALVRDGARTRSSTSQDTMQMVVSYLESVEPAIVEIEDELDRSTDVGSVYEDYHRQREPYSLCQVSITTADDDDSTYTISCVTDDVRVPLYDDTGGEHVESVPAWSRAKNPSRAERVERDVVDCGIVIEVPNITPLNKNGAELLYALRDGDVEANRVSIGTSTLFAHDACVTPQMTPCPCTDDAATRVASAPSEATIDCDDHPAIEDERRSGVHFHDDASPGEAPIVEFDNEAWSRLLSARTQERSGAALSLLEEDMRRRFSTAFA